MIILKDSRYFHPYISFSFSCQTIFLIDIIFKKTYKDILTEKKIMKFIMFRTEEEEALVLSCPAFPPPDGVVDTIGKFFGILTGAGSLNGDATADAENQRKQLNDQYR